jgi:rare lipoprotein A
LRLRSAGRVRPLHAAIGALALGSTLSVAAPALAEAPAAPASTLARPPVVRDRTLRLGQRADVRARFSTAEVGREAALQYAPHGGRWRVVATTVVEAGGHARFRVRLERSGAVRLALLPDATASDSGAVAAGAAVTSRARRVAVAGRIVVAHRAQDVNAGSALHVRGTLLPRTRGRRIVVEADANGRWRAVARTRTRANGHFDARLVAEVAGTARLRLRFAGDRRNARTRAGAGMLRTFRPSVASWYALYGGALACGGTLGYDTLGVANKSLPCGTKVTLRYRGREVTVPVVDRGPYVGGREWDLTGATARALGFDGVGVVWTTR